MSTQNRDEIYNASETTRRVPGILPGVRRIWPSNQGHGCGPKDPSKLYIDNAVRDAMAGGHHTSADRTHAIVV